MKNNILTAIILIVLLTMAFFVGYEINKPCPAPTYTTSDSLELVRIDSVKGIYQQEIDRIKAQKTIYVDRIKWKKQRDTVIYQGDDTLCSKIINRKDSIICDLDSALTTSDIEAQKYSEKLYLEEQKNKLEIKRFNAFSFKMDSTIGLYRDSLKMERKQLKKERNRTLFYKITTTVAATIGIYWLMK